MLTISKISHQHHETIVRNIDALVPLADAVAVSTTAELRPRLAEAHAFLAGSLMPHMAAAETALYPALDSLLSDPMAMEPMRREHATVRRLVAELGMTIDRLHDPLTVGQRVTLRRTLFRLFAIVRTHLGEEDLYLPALEHNISPEAAATIAQAMEHATVSPL